MLYCVGCRLLRSPDLTRLLGSWVTLGSSGHVYFWCCCSSSSWFVCWALVYRSLVLCVLPGGWPRLRTSHTCSWSGSSGELHRSVAKSSSRRDRWVALQVSVCPSIVSCRPAEVNVWRLPLLFPCRRSVEQKRTARTGSAETQERRARARTFERRHATGV